MVCMYVCVCRRINEKGNVQNGKKLIYQWMPFANYKFQIIKYWIRCKLQNIYFILQFIQ